MDKNNEKKKAYCEMTYEELLKEKPLTDGFHDSKKAAELSAEIWKREFQMQTGTK